MGIKKIKNKNLPRPKRPKASTFGLIEANGSFPINQNHKKEIHISKNLKFSVLFFTYQKKNPPLFSLLYFYFLGKQTDRLEKVGRITESVGGFGDGQRETIRDVIK